MHSSMCISKDTHHSFGFSARFLGTRLSEVQILFLGDPSRKTCLCVHFEKGVQWPYLHLLNMNWCYAVTERKRLYPGVGTELLERYRPDEQRLERKEKNTRHLGKRVYKKSLNLGLLCLQARPGRHFKPSERRKKIWSLYPFIHKKQFLDYKARHQKNVFSSKRIFVIDCEFQLRKELGKHQSGMKKGIAGRLVEIPSSLFFWFSDYIYIFFLITAESTLAPWVRVSNFKRL